MAIRLSALSQKGGVAKSTIARLIAAEYARNEWDVLIADMDLSQGTSYRWQQRRLQADITPDIAVQQFRRVKTALDVGENFDLVIFDGAPHSDRQTLELAQVSDLVILPTGIALDDLDPTVRLAYELIEKGIKKEKLAIVFCRVGNSEVEYQEAVDFFRSTAFFLLSGFLPERTAYRRASDTGRAASETTHKSLNKKADEIVQAIIDRIEEVK